MKGLALAIASQSPAAPRGRPRCHPYGSRAERWQRPQKPQGSQGLGCGLDLLPDALPALRAAADPLAPQHDSLTELWKFAIALGPIEAVERPIGNAARLARDPLGIKFPLVEANETTHPSVRKRLGHQVELRSEHDTKTITYQPADLPIA